jgi:hypothetical protein
MPTINSTNPKVDQTVKIFDQFYEYETTVSTEEYDAVYSYFRSIYGTTEAAGNFTVTLFRVANESDIPVMNLLQSLQGKGVPELTVTLAYYLNSLRSPATLLGINSPVTPNYYVARNVLA